MFCFEIDLYQTINVTLFYTVDLRTFLQLHYKTIFVSS